MSSATQHSLIRPVVRTLYRQLFRLADEYGTSACASNLTVKQEIDRFTSAVNSTSRKTTRKAANNRVDNDDDTTIIPVGGGLVFAIRTGQADDSSHSSSLNRYDSTKSVSELDSFAEMLAATSVDGSVTLNSTITRQIIREQFRHPKTSHDLNEQQLIGVGFLALRTIKERIQSLKTNLLSSAVGTVPPKAGDLSFQKDVVAEPSLTDLTTEVTTENEDIRVHIKTKYNRMPEQSLASQSSSPLFASISSTPHMFSYEITITNIHPSRTVQLLKRAWTFTDSKGVCQRIRGAGVIGQTPVLVPQGKFQYESHVNLQETRGQMVGAFTFQLIEDPQKSSPLKSGEMFDVPVGPVLLAATQKGASSQATET